MNRKHDTPQDANRTRRAKGSVKEAIGKIIGDAAIEERGSRESEAAARQADARHDIEKDGTG